MTEEPIVVDVRLTQADYMHFNKWHFYKRNPISSFLVVMSYLSIGLFLLVNLWPNRWIQCEFTQSLYMLILPFFYLVFIPYSVVAGYKKMAKSDPSRLEMHYEFLPDCIRVTLPASKVEETWANYQNVVETPSHYFLYLSSVQARIIPKRDLSEDKLATFREFIDRNIDKTKLVRG